MAITFRTARTVIENAILDRLAEEYLARLPTVANIAALRARVSTALPDQLPALIYVTSAGYAYRWRPWVSTADNGTTVIKPDDVSSGSLGRWVRTSSTSASGYIRYLDLYNDDVNDELIEQRIYGDKPALLITYEGTSHKPMSARSGALYWATLRFTVMAVSKSLRGEQYARQGSGLSAESTVDPGTAAILGDVKDLLAGMDGDTLGVEEVASIEIGDEEPVLKDLARRAFVEALEIEVRCTITHEDSDTVTLDDPFEFTVQRQLAHTNSTTFDDENYVTEGLHVPTGTGLTKTIAAGTAYVGSTLVSVNATAKTFTANRVTYRDLFDDGTYEYHETTVGQDAPDVSTGALRVGATITDGTGVIMDTLLADSLLDYEDEDKVDPPTLLSIAVSPSAPSVATGNTQAFTAIGTFEDGSTADVTMEAEWSSSNEAVASVNAAGTALGISGGTASIAAVVDDITSNAATLTVS
jgi:phage gp37-like protein